MQNIWYNLYEGQVPQVENPVRWKRNNTHILEYCTFWLFYPYTFIALFLRCFGSEWQDKTYTSLIVPSFYPVVLVS